MRLRVLRWRGRVLNLQLIFKWHGVDIVAGGPQRKTVFCASAGGVAETGDDQIATMVSCCAAPGSPHGYVARSCGGSHPDRQKDTGCVAQVAPTCGEAIRFAGAEFIPSKGAWVMFAESFLLPAIREIQKESDDAGLAGEVFSLRARD